MAKVELSPTMRSCLKMARKNGGELIRYDGNFWAARNCATTEQGAPIKWYGQMTVDALVKRDLAIFADDMSFVQLTDAGRAFELA